MGTRTPLHIVRSKRGHSTREVAEAVGVNQSQYSRVESGKRRPSPDLANRIAKHFGNEVTRDQILFPEDYLETGKRPSRSARLQEAS